MTPTTFVIVPPADEVGRAVMWNVVPTETFVQTTVVVRSLGERFAAQAAPRSDETKLTPGGRMSVTVALVPVPAGLDTVIV